MKGGFNVATARKFLLTGGKLVEFDTRPGDLPTGGPSRPSGWRNTRQSDYPSIPFNTPEYEAYFREKGTFPPYIKKFDYSPLP